MSARRYTVRLYWRTAERKQIDLNFDPTDDAALRTLLEQLVITEYGSLQLDLSEWSLVVHSLGGGQIRARCRITELGATHVER